MFTWWQSLLQQQKRSNKVCFSEGFIHVTISIKRGEVNVIDRPQVQVNAPPAYRVVKCNVLASNSPLVHLAAMKKWCVCVNWEGESGLFLRTTMDQQWPSSPEIPVTCSVSVCGTESTSKHRLFLNIKL